MPIDTSVITGTVAHKHSATGGSSDGGKLATGGLGGDTSFDLASGSMMYSNGTSLDELTIGGAGSALTVSGGVPTWGSGGGDIEKISTAYLSSDAANLHHTWSAVDFDDYACVTVFFNGWIQNSGTDLFIRLQNPVIATSNYYSERWVCAGGTNSSSSQTADRITLPTNSKSYRGRIDITAADSNNTNDRCLQWFLQCICTSSNAMVLQAGYLDSCNVTPVTESTGIYYVPAGGNIKEGWFSTAFKYSR